VQLSVTVGAKVAIADWLLVHSTSTRGQVRLGDAWSETVTLPLQDAGAPSKSVQVSMTAVVPTAYGPAGACTQLGGVPSGSYEPSSIEAVA